MSVLSFLLQVLALILLFCAALGVAVPRVQAGWLGMALWLLSLMTAGVVLHSVH